MNLKTTPYTINNQITFTDNLRENNNDNIVYEIMLGLNSEQKYISSKFFYNNVGSQLFEEITSLPEYYPTRTEKEILKSVARELIGNGESIDIIELGSGDCSKISILLGHLTESQINETQYIPIDISKAAIIKSAELLSLKYPCLKIHGIISDFMKQLFIPRTKSKKLICFFGSTIGNLTRSQSVSFLINLKNQMQPTDKLLLGLDMVKDIETLENAYNDYKGVTAAFNKNILNVINDYTGTNFNTNLFTHLSFYNKNKARIEMHLIANTDMNIYCETNNSTIHIKTGETIHTENSYKFTVEDIHILSSVTGLKIEKIFTDNKKMFSLVLFNNQ